MTAVLRISLEDNVAVALESVTPGSVVSLPDVRVVARDAIPSGHKIALVSIAAGQPVIKYGNPIGIATAAIEPGDHVHTHNLESTRGRGDKNTGPK